MKDAEKQNEPPAKHTINMRRHRKSIFSGLKPSDKVVIKHESGNGWIVRIYSSNGVQISHERLTFDPKPS